jgi:hypothetical protein
MTITMYASVTVKGTAMAETALCGVHEADPELVAHAVANGDSDWDKGPRHDCTGNDALECYACGAS